MSQRGLQRSEHAQCGLHAAVKVGAGERVATTNERRPVEDAHMTGTVGDRGQDLQEGSKVTHLS